MNRTLRICVLIVCCCYFCAGSADIDSLRINTKHGKVEGKYSDNGEARVFKSIRYAKPVDGPNRWKDAQPPEPWLGTIITTVDPPACPQSCDTSSPGCPDPSIQKEDCLFLNIFTPSNANPWSKLPVLVFIHGGAYVFGYSASKLYDGSYLASHSNIIVVTMNYRLGALGFLVYGSGDDGITGNFGIKDQRLALKWVRDNIAFFGGDPNQVTLSGESAGAMSVAIHMTSVKSAGLFHKAIIESDPFGIDYKTAENEKTHGNSFASKLSCKQDTDFDCLRDKDVAEILEAQGKMKSGYSIHFWSHLLPWAPVIDGDQLMAQPLARFRSGHFTEVPTILGTTSAEGILFVYGKFKKAVSFVEYPVVIGFIFLTNAYKVLKLYPPKWGDNRLQLSDVFTDYAFYCPTILAAQSVSGFPVYSYIFDHPFPNIPNPEPPQCKDQACHGAELPYVFHTYEESYTTEEKQLADKVSAYWGNFVNTGNPNIPPAHKDTCDADGCMELTLPDWPKFTSAEWTSLKMDVSGFQVTSDYRKKYCDVLNDIGYGFDAFGALDLSVDVINSIADIKEE